MQAMLSAHNKSGGQPCDMWLSKWHTLMSIFHWDMCTVNHPYLSHSTCALILDLIVAQVQFHQPLIGVLLQCLTDPPRT